MAIITLSDAYTIRFYRNHITQQQAQVEYNSNYNCKIITAFFMIKKRKINIIWFLNQSMTCNNKIYERENVNDAE